MLWRCISRFRPCVSTSLQARTTPWTSYATDSIEILQNVYARDEMTNVTPTVIARIGRNLHNIPHHPVQIIKQRVVSHFHKRYVSRTGNALFAHFDNVSPLVTTEQNFDSLLVPPGHVSRAKNDSYYVNSTHMLRAHTSAHQQDFIKMGCNQFLVTGDVYRRDAIDSSHYPTFHQMEGVRLFSKHELFPSTDELEILEQDPTFMVETDEKQLEHTIDAAKMLELDLKRTLEALVKELFGKNIKMRWVSCYFPFTHPSFELEIEFQGKWMEVLGSGVMRQGILTNGGAHNKVGWAFGLGLDRLAMQLFSIPDIRLLWSEDSRFINQFLNVDLDPQTNVLFKEFSKHPPCYKDISFWINGDYNHNDFYEIVRSVGGDLVEEVVLVDQFQHPETSQQSYCYRIMYRAMDRSFTNTEVNVIQATVREQVQELNVDLR